jgi:hypothetical protein
MHQVRPRRALKNRDHPSSLYASEDWETGETRGLPIIWRRNKLAQLLFLPFGRRMCWQSRDGRERRGSCQLTLSAPQQCLRAHSLPASCRTLQGSDIFQVTRSRLGRWFTARALRACDRVLVLSRAWQATALACRLTA